VKKEVLVSHITVEPIDIQQPELEDNLRIEINIESELSDSIRISLSHAEAKDLAEAILETINEQS